MPAAPQEILPKGIDVVTVTGNRPVGYVPSGVQFLPGGSGYGSNALRRSGIRRVILPPKGSGQRHTFGWKKDTRAANDEKKVIDVINVYARRPASTVASVYGVTAIIVGSAALALKQGHDPVRAVTQLLGAATAKALEEGLMQQIVADITEAQKHIELVDVEGSTVVMLDESMFLPYAADSIRVARERMHAGARDRSMVDDWRAAEAETWARQGDYDAMLEQQARRSGLRADPAQVNQWALPERVTVADEDKTVVAMGRLSGLNQVIDWQLIPHTFADPTGAPAGAVVPRPLPAEVPAGVPAEVPAVQPMQVVVPEISPGFVPESVWLPASSLLVNPMLNGRLSIRSRSRTVENPRLQLRRQTKEARTPRKDAKDRSMQAYLAAMRFVTKTWGKVSELLDFANAAQANMMVSGPIRSTNGRVLHLRTPTALSELPVRFRPDALRAAAEGRVAWDFNETGFLMDLLIMEATDRAFAAGSKAENRVLQSLYGDSHPMRNMFGNPSTWTSRFSGGL